ncbi:MAG TPA: glycosyltransferase family 2 protein [Thiotrichaceae bacterium]|jgi:glycosyltransferase involved in cell wall biosynthesis|nr:glycosyltransferase family 2 protein [Thiotrichaceae bacterium]
MKISIIIPALNEGESLKHLLPVLVSEYPNTEIIIVDDGSTDVTKEICAAQGVICLSHPYRKGNGAAIKTGVRAATGKMFVFMDADGQHDPKNISGMLKKIDEGFDMVVGARSASSQASVGRLCANTLYNWFASFMVGQKIEDLTSGFRAVRAEKFKKFLYLLPNGFSYPTTCTMAFFRSGYSVGYIPIEANKRIGKSHIKLLKDGIRFLLILFKIGTLYSPLKIFFPLSLISLLTGMLYYVYTFMAMGRFTNMSALLFTTSVTIFLMGLISEQITSLLYSKAGDN